MSSTRVLDVETVVRHGIASVLVVDDDEDLREEIVELIENEGYTATGVTDGKEALDYLTIVPTKPKLMLLDLMMPAMDGWEVLNEMRQSEMLATIPVVIISARYTELAGASVPGLRVRSMAKPLDSEALLSVVRETCGPER